MQTAIIVWLYVVGLAVSWALLHEVNRGFFFAITWPASIPLIMVLRWSGLLRRVSAWAERNANS
jgi:hypothetical protein